MHMVQLKNILIKRSLHVAKINKSLKKINNFHKNKPAAHIQSLSIAIKKQSGEIKKLNGRKVHSSTIVKQAEHLLNVKEKLNLETKKLLTKKKKIQEFRTGLNDLLIRKFFYAPSFEIYGSVSGLYDFGPLGCASKDNLLNLWRQHFVLSENMLEMSSSALTPKVVLEASGHVAKFSDFMVRNVKTGDCYRADKLLENFIDQILENPTENITEKEKNELLVARSLAATFNQKELAEALDKYKIKIPNFENNISEPFPFNLMFSTTIGPTNKSMGFLRPEIAQGIFVNF